MKEAERRPSRLAFITSELWASRKQNHSQRQKVLPVLTLQLNGTRQTLTWSDGGGATVTLQVTNERTPEGG